MKIRIDLGYTVYTVALQLDQSNWVNEWVSYISKSTSSCTSHCPPSTGHTVTTSLHAPPRPCPWRSRKVPESCSSVRETQTWNINRYLQWFPLGGGFVFLICKEQITRKLAGKLMSPLASHVNCCTIAPPNCRLGKHFLDVYVPVNLIG